ncbi:hypothetical protein BG011_007235 [Mortierella polycephala]|uniref:Proliferation-associated SNF2-like protein n=1 Tax=Mortierella polycephala TaxID=41804 RepID=A0A9P6QBK5_9FUNG|nr:hypothetical protein BG011_007235 [Mortierella polycephala]
MSESSASTPVTPMEPSVGTPTSDSAESSIDAQSISLEGRKPEESTENKTAATATPAVQTLTSKSKDSKEFQQTVEQQRFQRLSFLLQKSTVYTHFLAKKMEQQQQEAREKAMRQAIREAEKEKKTTTEGDDAVETEVGTRVSTRHGGNHESQATAAKKKTKGPTSTSSAKKRKAEHDEYNIADYVDKDMLKKQKQTEAVDTATTAKTVFFRQPKLVTGGVLRDYQLEGVEWLVSLHQNGLNGILADEMGLGKTLQTISFLAFLCEKSNWGPFLIVAPLSTLANWVIEFERFAPDIPVLLYHGTPEEREHMRKHKMKKPGTKTFPVIVTSYEITMKDRTHLSKFKWRYIIVDEGHRLKNMDCKLIRELKSYDSANRLLLTGTPLQNNLTELWSLLNFLLPEIFDQLALFKEWFDFSDIDVKEGQERIQKQESERGIVSSLHQILKPFLLRRIKTDVEVNLPKKKEYLLYAPLTSAQKEWYDAALSHDIRDFLIRKKCGIDANKDEEADEEIPLDVMDAMIDADDNQAEKTEKTTAAIARRRTRAVVKSYAENSGDELDKEARKIEATKAIDAREVDLRKATKSVANMKLMNVVMQLRKACNHPYLFEWPEDYEPEDLLNSSGKMLVLNRLLEALFSRGHKVLIFSQFTSMLDIIHDWAEINKGWTCCRIDGSVPQTERRRQILEFNTNPSLKLFLLSTRAGGLGINLTSADTVIIFDSDWNPQMDLQAQDRVHRIGQTKPVLIYRLVTANTVEGKIIEKANSKRKLEKLVIHKDKFKRLSLADSMPSERKTTTLAEIAEMLAHNDGEEIQLATKDDVVISDKHLEMLLDRSDAAYASNISVTADSSDAGVTMFKTVEEVRDDQNDILKVDKMAAAV